MAVSVSDLAIALRVSRDGEDLGLGNNRNIWRGYWVLPIVHVSLLIPTAPEPIQSEVMSGWRHTCTINR